MQPCVLSLIDHAHPAATEFLDNAVVRDGLVNHYVDASFLVASSYGRGAGQSMKTVLARSASRTLPFVIGVLSGTRTHTAIQKKKDHKRVVGYSYLIGKVRFARQPEGTPQQEPLRLGNAEANLSAQVLHRVKNR